MKITGTLGLLRGFLSFNLTCLAGAFVNFAVAVFLTSQFAVSIYAANLVGIAFATAWNYTINLHVTWRS